MTQDQINNLKNFKETLNTNKIQFTELNEGFHFRLRKPYQAEYSVDIWPTTLKWQDQRAGIKGNGIESFLKFWTNVQNPLKSESDLGVYPRKLERICSGHGGAIERLKVPGGWIVSNVIHEQSISSLFLKDKKHEWNLEEEND